MARSKRRNGSKKITKAQRSFYVMLQANASGYLDIGECLSAINRRGYDQGYCYGIESIEFDFSNVNPTLVDVVSVSAFVASDTWVTHNAFVKAKALWEEMNALVLEDNPSIEGKWAGFKIFLDGPMRTAHSGGGAGNLQPLGGDAAAYQMGEWDYSDFVLPQHDVDPVTGFPDPADQTQAHLIGPDIISPTVGYQSVGLINAYQESRATVFPDAPNVPAGMGNSFFNLLTDSGSQEPELADVIRLEGDNPPYALDNYPQGALNSPYPVNADFDSASVGQPNGQLGPFVVPCGLLLLKADSFKDGAEGPTLPILMRVTLMAGEYKGIAAIPMGQ